MMTSKELTEHLEAARYRFAYTMIRCPHWYTLRETWSNKKVFEAVVRAIRHHGVVRPWPQDRPRYWHTYFDAGEWTYWTMGAPVGETILINRAKVSSSGR